MADLAIDGLALEAQAAYTQNMHSTSDSALLIQISELKRKVERKDIEIKRISKENLTLKKDAGQMDREIKRMQVDLESLRDRNKTLQGSLSNARMLSADAREDAENKAQRNKNRELSDEMLALKHERRQLENEAAGAAVAYAELENDMRKVRATANDANAAFDEVKINLDLTEDKIRSLNVLNADKDTEIERCVEEMNRLKGIEQELASEVVSLKGTILEKDVAFTDLNQSFAALKSQLDVRNETNASLRGQLEDINSTKFVITKEELDQFKKIENEHHKMKMRNRELVKSVETHMNLLEQSEQMCDDQKEELGKLKDKYTDTTRNADNLRTQLTSTTDNYRTLKKQAGRLIERERELETEVERLTLDPLHRDKEVAGIRAGMTNLVQSRAQEVEARRAEREYRKAAEKAATAMKSRISFLLHQLDQASQLVVNWQEENTTLRAEVGAIHRINAGLRKRLMGMQTSFVTRNLGEAMVQQEGRMKLTVQSRSETNPRILAEQAFADKQMERDPLERVLLDGGVDPDANLAILGDMYDQPAAESLPNGLSAVIERAVFDSVCAFSSTMPRGDRKKLEKTGRKLRGNLVTYIGDDGLLAIRLDGAHAINGDEGSPEEIDAEELMNGLQVHAFLKFVQHKTGGKLCALYTEKIASILNFLRKSTGEMATRLGLSRSENAKLQSKIVVTGQRVLRMKNRLVNERVAKQKTMMKYIREQMRQSDVRCEIDSITTRARDQLEDLEETTGGIAGRETALSREVVRQLLSVGSKLAAVGMPSGTATGPVGSIELRLPESLMDDETLHGMYGLLSGELTKSDDNGDDDVDKNENGSSGAAEGDADEMALTKLQLLKPIPHKHRVLLLNLQGNMLTDLSCSILADMVSTSPHLRMLDLRSNLISAKGARILFDASRRNPTVLYVTQRQNGFMIEGHREIVGQQRGGRASHSVQPEEQDDLDRLVGQPKHPLRVDIRLNSSGAKQTEDLVENFATAGIDTSTNQVKSGGAPTGSSSGSGGAGITPSKGRRPQSAARVRSPSPGTFGSSGGPRPLTAGSSGGDGSRSASKREEVMRASVTAGANSALLDSMRMSRAGPEDFPSTALGTSISDWNREYDSGALDRTGLGGGNDAYGGVFGSMGTRGASGMAGRSGAPLSGATWTNAGLGSEVRDSIYAAKKRGDGPSLPHAAPHDTSGMESRQVSALGDPSTRNSLLMHTYNTAMDDLKVGMKGLRAQSPMAKMTERFNSKKRPSYNPASPAPHVSLKDRARVQKQQQIQTASSATAPAITSRPKSASAAARKSKKSSKRPGSAKKMLSAMHDLNPGTLLW
jgi:hypothetical protein